MATLITENFSFEITPIQLVTKNITPEDSKNLRPHALAEEFGLCNDKALLPLFKAFASQTKYLPIYGRIICTEDHEILSNFHVWAAAKTNRYKIKQVDYITGIKTENDSISLLHFLIMMNVFVHRSASGKCKLFSKISHMLTETEEGKDYAENVAGKNTVEKISTLTGYDVSTIQKYLSQAAKDPS